MTLQGIYSRRSVQFIGASLLCLLSLLLLQTNKASAVVLNPDPGANIPAHLRTYLQNCDSYGPSPAFVQWVSIDDAADPNNLASTGVSVPYGSTAPIRLRYNAVGVVCQRASTVTATAVSVVGSSPVEVTNITGAFLALSYGGAYNIPGTYVRVSQPFTYTPSAPITSSQVISITLATKFMNRFTNNVHGCVPGPGGNRVSFSRIDECITNFPTFNIDVVVPQNIPVGTIDAATCRRWSGWAFDADRPNDSIFVHIYADAPAGTPGAVFVGSYLANSSRSDVNAAFGIGGQHGFEIDVPLGLQGTGRTIYAYAIGVNGLGAQDGSNAYLGSRAYDACPAAPNVSCSVARASITAGGSTAAAVTIRHDGPASAGAISYNGTIAIQSMPTEGIGGTLGNGATVTRSGSNRSYPTPGTYTITALFTYTSTTGNGDFSCPGQITVVAPPPVIRCDVTSVSIEEGGSTGVPVVIRHQGPSYAANVSYTATVTIASQPTQVLTGTVTNSNTSLQTTTPRTYPAGVYAVTVTVVGTGGGFNVSAPPCSGTVTASTQPYLRTYSNDVQTGSGFGSSCSTGTGQVRTYNRGSSFSFAGSGGQLGTFAKAAISGFRSASTRSGLEFIPQALSFSNRVSLNVSVNQFGGLFGATLCSPDYWSGSGLATYSAVQTIDLATISSGSYFYRPNTAGTPIVITGILRSGVKVSLYIDGNVVVRSSTGTRVGYGDGPWGTVATIPSLYVIARGNIGIASNITVLDGHYIAQHPQTTSGRITTCVDPTTLAQFASDATLVANCRSRLTINGSFSAYKVNFMRATVTTRLATASELAATTNASEVFVFPLETYLGTQPTTTTSKQTYDSITALPPAL